MADWRQVAELGGEAVEGAHDFAGCRCGQCTTRAEAGETGTVTISAATTVWTNDEIAAYLSHGFWGGQSYRFAIVAGGMLGVNIAALPSAAQFLAREALALWSDVTGIVFNEVTSGEQILFTDTQAGAYASYSISGNTIVGATVNISVDWLTRYGTALNTYSFQTYLHEIGHALGLGHAGDYNGSATYATDALYANDSWSASLMSYFSQTQNSYTAGLGFTRQFVVTPTVADALATTSLYGAATTVRTGDTVYGFGNTSGRAVYDASRFAAVSYTVYDDGGIDTLDYSGFSASQKIDLNPEMFSNVGGRIGNVSIARGAIIENAISGSGADTLIGNAAANRLVGNAGNDVLDGGAGADDLIGGTGDDLYRVDSSGDRVVEAAGGGIDRVVTTADYALLADSHVEQLAAADPLALSPLVLVGNGLRQDITGNSGNNLLNGQGGSDALSGLLGDDYYVVFSTDLVLESQNGGYDIVAAHDGFQLNLGVHVELLVTTFSAGTAALNLIGNELAQQIVGNAGNNILNGMGGADAMSGLGGDDYYVIDGDDIVFEGVGNGYDIIATRVDHVLAGGSEVEMLVTADEGGIGALALTGNEQSQTIWGNAGANRIDGGNGADTLRGLGGSDTFVFSTGLGAGNIDRILDFEVGTDKVATDDVVFANMSVGALAAGAFRTGSAAQDADDRILYDPSNGALLFDADGNGAGAAVQFATLNAGLNLSAADFVVI